ncbi:MAG TPA: hypothetical protein VFK54_00960 [Candidatus Limnocylindrales bacterium]|nr:hypothetical protein [Candidatus Limnocylindrales bacterium]
MSTIRGGLGRAFAALLSSVMLLGLLGTTGAAAATTTDAWQARVGRSGVNGTARINRYVDGTGATVYKLKGMRASTTLPVTVHRGTCSSVGAVVARLASVRSSSSGAVSRTVAITAAQMKPIAAAGAGAGKLAIRVGSGSSIRCGAFARQGVAPYVAARVTVGGLPQGVAVDGDNVYVSNWYDNSVSRISASTNAVTATIPVVLTGNAGPQVIAVAAGSLWVATTEWDASNNPLPGSLVRIDPATGAALATLPIGEDAASIAVSPGYVWVRGVGGSILKIDVATNQVVATISTSGRPYGLAYGEGAIWVSSPNESKVHRIDPATNQVVASVTTQLPAAGLAAGGGAIWAMHPALPDTPTGLVSRIDPLANSVATTIAAGIEPYYGTFAGGSLWVSLNGEPTVLRISPATNAITARIAVSGPSWEIASSATSVWVVQPNLPPAGTLVIPLPAGTVTRIGF